MQQLPQKDSYKLSEVCKFTDTQPYVLRFWESEFPQLAPGKSASGQRLYKKKDIAVVCRIKELLYTESRSVAEARQQLSDELAKGKRLKVAPPAPRATQEAEPEAVETKPVEPAKPRARKPRATAERDGPEPEMVSRQRYEDAIDEIDHLRMELREAEKSVQRAETAVEDAQALAAREQERADRAADHIEEVLKLLS